MADDVELAVRLDERVRTLRSAAQKLLDAAAQLRPDSGIRLPRVNGRELETLRAAAAGKSNVDIAQEQYVSVETVKTRLHTVYGKLGARGRAHAVAMAYECGLLVPAYLAARAAEVG